MQTSPDGIAALEHEEGVVLRAYRCPAGKWTIGAGITSAAGVGKVGPGMVITAARARAMLSTALSRNYEPSVTGAMPGAAQHEFDAGVSFHFNTGAIGRASWVKLWRGKATQAAISAKFKLWNKGGGKVLPGLVKRRERELEMLFDGKYAAPKTSRPSVNLARWTLPLSADEKSAVLVELMSLGYNVGADATAVSAAEIRRFQIEHGLTADGIIGRATLSTLQRRIDAAAEAKAGAVVGAGGAAAAPQSDLIEQIAGVPHLGAVVAVAAVAVVVWIAWRRRDVIAAKINARAPKAAAFLRSF
jgi:lysozyme